ARVDRLREIRDRFRELVRILVPVGDGVVRTQELASFGAGDRRRGTVDVARSDVGVRSGSLDRRHSNESIEALGVGLEFVTVLGPILANGSRTGHRSR